MTSIMTVPHQDTLIAISRLASFVTDNPQNFLRPSSEVQQAAIRAAKVLLDPLATSVATSQATRRDENRKKRKRGDDVDEQPVLQLRQVYTDGFGVKQVWEQAKRILDAAGDEIGRDLRLHPTSERDQKLQIKVVNDEDGFSESDQVDSLADDDSIEDEDDFDEEDSEDNLDDDVDEEEVEGDDIEPEEDIEADSDVMESSDDEKSRQRDIYIPDPNGLNDGFFSIDDFNKQSQFLEQMDARGDEDNPSDEDDIDWDADPLSSGMTTDKPKKQNDDAEDDGSDEEDGPTFGDADLDASEDEDEDMMDDDDQDMGEAMGGASNANDIKYADFFEPPAQKPSKTKRMRALPKTQPPKESKAAANGTAKDDTERLQTDLERAMADVRRDLLDSDAEVSEEDEDDSDDGLGPRKSKSKGKNLSTHEKQRAEIAAQIRSLEAANVAKRDWQLSGEARAADRPVNSLIEEDLEFERAGKPIAPVTVETTEEIDALIKRRILAREFDEVIRRVPGSLNLANDTRRGRIELDDSKPQASLGEIYENEYQKKNADPLTYVDKNSAATKKQHTEIDMLWRQVREQLDLLSNMHFKPKRADIEIKTVEDKPRITMEDARPVGEIESGEGGMLAPQEVYRPGADSKRNKDEVMLQSGAAVSKEEMTREEKLRRRRREKERGKKALTNKEVKMLGKPKKEGKRKINNAEKADIIEDLKRGGVKLVGKGGELQNIGKQKKDRKEGPEVIASNLKL